MFNLKLNCIRFMLFSFAFCQVKLPPTQPSWLVDNTKAKTKEENVKVNLKNLLETASIRSEIELAVLEHKYAVGGKDEDKIVQEADRELGEEFRSHTNNYALLGSALNDRNFTLNFNSSEHSLKDENDLLHDIIPNKVVSALIDEGSTANTMFIPEYHADHYISIGGDTRDVLKLNLIEEDLSFQLGEGVDTWRNFPNGDILGLTESKLTLTRNIEGEYRIVSELRFNEPTETMETISLWNTTSRSLSNIALVSLRSTIQWINTEDMSTIWEWRVGARSYCIRAFNAEGKHYLATLVDGMIAIYQYDILKREFFASQVISVEKSTREMEYLDPGYHMILAVPQNNSIMIFQSDQLTEKSVYFSRVSSIPTENVTSIHAFQMGGFSYLAVAGHQPKIYRYHYGTFHPQTILESNFGVVNMFLAVPCRTYRDDMILLVQHQIDFETHSITVVEPLIWNGEAFESTKSVPCKVGETIELFGASCILDMEREQGLRGASVVSSRGQVLLVVPRFESSSGLFRIDFELVPRQPEIDDLQSILKQMEAMVADQEEVLRILENQTWSIGELETDYLFFNEPFGKLLLNNEIWEEDELQISLDGLLADLESIQEDVNAIKHDFIVEQAFIKDLHIDNMNDEPYKEIKELEYAGTIVVPGDLTVEHLVNVSAAKSRNSENQSQLDILEIEGDLEFETINGIAWEQFVDGVVFKDMPTQLEALQVDKAIIYGNLSTEFLNDISFPDGFLLSSGPRTSTVTGKKRFLNLLNADAMDCEDAINGIKPEKFISLRYNQTIPGITTFNQLEVTKSFEINGTISGKNLENFVPHPTLIDTNHIKSECQFKKIEVDGPIIIKGQFNEQDFDFLLNDFIYTSEQNISIVSSKTFNELRFEDSVTLSSNRISDVDLDDFITQSTDQELSVSEIEGTVSIDNLELQGLYNFVNVTEMEANSIKLNADQTIDSGIIFNNGDLLEVDAMDISEKLNQIPISDFLNIHDPIQLDSAFIPQLNVDYLNSNCNVDGTGLLNGVDLGQFRKDRFSISENQTVEVNVEADRVDIEDDIAIQSINGLPVNNVLTFLNKSSNTTNVLRSAKHLRILGNITVKTINHMSTDQLWSNVIWLDRQNTIDADIQFLDSIHLHRDLHLKSNRLNDRNFEEFAKNLALKSDRDSGIVIGGTTRFKLPIDVAGDARIEYFNDIPAEHLATKVRPLKVEGDFEVDGDLAIHSLDMEGEKFANYTIQEIFESYQYDPNDDMHYVSGEVEFKGRTVVDRLNVGGKINKMEGPAELFKNIVYRNYSGVLFGKKTLQNVVGLDQGAYIENLNGLNVPDFLKNLVYVNEAQPVEIWNAITFKKAVTAEQTFAKGDVVTSSIMGCVLNEWLDNSLRIDQPVEVDGPIYFQPGVLDSNNLLAVYLNNKLLSNMITLHTPQNFTGNATIPYAYLDGSITVSGKVNNLNLIKERKNTLMIYGDQHITAPVVTQTLRVLHNLETQESVHGRDLREIATLHENLHLKSSLSFKEIHVDKIYTNDLIAGLNFTQWHRTSLKTNFSTDQSITGTWSMDELSVETSSLVIEPPLLIESHADLFPTVKNLKEHYVELCDRVLELRRKASNRVSYLKYLRKKYEFVREKLINSVHSIIFADNTLMLINQECVSSVYRWQAKDESFHRIGKLESGNVDHVEVLFDQSFIIHPKSNAAQCRFFGSSHWQFTGDGILRKGSSKQGKYSQYAGSRSARSTDRDNSEAPDFHGLIDGIGNKLIDDLRAIHHSSENSPSSPIVSSPAMMKIKHTVGHVAKKLLAGALKLDDVKSIMHHAKKIYRTLVHHDDDVDDSKGESHSSKYNNDHESHSSKHNDDHESHHFDESSGHHKEHEHRHYSHHDHKDEHHNHQDRIDLHSLHDHNNHKEFHREDHNDQDDDTFEHHHHHNHHQSDPENMDFDYDNLLHDHDHHNIHDHHKFPHEHFDELLGAKASSLPTLQPILSPLHNIHPLQRIDNALHNIPLAFRSFVEGTSATNEDESDHAIIDRISELISVVREAIHSMHLANHSSTESVKHQNLTDEKNVSDALTILRKHAEHNSELGESVDSIRHVFTNDSNEIDNERREAIGLQVGSKKNTRRLIAVISPFDYTSIRLYPDNLHDEMFQKIETVNPFGLTSLEIQDETILAFVENVYIIRVMRYKGVEGFTEWSSFHQDSSHPVTQLNFISLMKTSSICQHYYVVSVVLERIQLYEIVMGGMCPIRVSTRNCDGWWKQNIWDET